MHVSSPWVTAGLPVPYGFSSRLHNESLPFWGPFVPMRNSVSVKDEAGLISNTRADAWDTLLSHLCWCHSCWTVICNSVGWARRLFFFHRDFLPTRVSQAIALTSSGTVWHLNVNALASSSVYLCNSEKENRRGSWWQSTLESCLGTRSPSQLKQDSLHMLLRHWQTMINKQTLTQCDISRSLSLSLSPDSSRVSEF